MKSFFVSAALVAAADALVARDSPWYVNSMTDFIHSSNNSISSCFHLTASGGPGGVVGQLSDGQNRIGQGTYTSCFLVSFLTDVFPQAYPVLNIALTPRVGSPMAMVVAAF